MGIIALDTSHLTQHMPPSSILLTGATGLLGRACLSHLKTRHGADQIVAAVRPGRDTSVLKRLGVRTLEMDLCASNLGIPKDIYRTLTESIRSIIHCAADIRFSSTLDQSRQVNVGGTENLLRLAAQCGRLDKFAHMSTVYVWGGKPGTIGEQASQPGAFFNPYQQTKFEAEQAVLAAMPRLPASIYRFSTMIYDCSGNCVSQFNYLHQLLRLAAVNPLRSIPALRNAKVDLIASDWAARIFDFFFEERWEPARIVHICAGAKHSLTVGELFDLTFEMLGLADEQPEIVGEEEFNRKADSILSTPSRKQMWSSLSQFLPHMNVDQTFECTHVGEAALHRVNLQPPDSRSMFKNALSYCLATQWGQSIPNQLNCPPQLEPVPAVHPKQ